MRALRENAGMSQTALATAMTERGHPWHQQTVGRVQSGAQPLRAAELIALAEIFGTTLDRFTWSTPESDTVDMMLRRGGVLAPLSENVSDAVELLLAARADAEETLAATEGSEWPRVLDFRPGLAERVARYTLDAAIAEGVRHYGDRSAEKGDDDAAQGES